MVFLETEKLILVRMTRPTFSNILFSFVFITSIFLWDILGYHYLYSLFVYIPWIIYIIRELTLKKLKATSQYLYVNEYRWTHNDIEKLVISDERVELFLRERTWLTKLIYLDAKTKHDREDFKKLVQEWKGHFNNNN